MHDLKNTPIASVAATLFWTGIVIAGCQESPTTKAGHLQHKRSGVSSMMINEFDFAQAQELVGPSSIIDSSESLEGYIAACWRRHVEQGPIAHKPTKALFAETPWEPTNRSNLYVGVYSLDAAADLLDFAVLGSYTSSIQQTLFSEGEADLRQFYPNHLPQAAIGLSEMIQNAEILIGHSVILARMREFELPQSAHFLTNLRYEAAICWNSEGELDMVAVSDAGYVVLFSIDG